MLLKHEEFAIGTICSQRCRIFCSTYSRMESSRGDNKIFERMLLLKHQVQNGPHVGPDYTRSDPPGPARSLNLFAV